VGNRLTGTLADATSQSIIATSEATAETKAGTLNGLDRVLQDIRAALGEGRTERWTNTVRLPAATTSSIEALRSYAIGGAAWSAGNFRVARELWQRALDLDTGFALAMGGLGAFHYYHHNRETGKRFYEEALRRVNRLTEWERLRISEGYAGALGDTARSFAIQRELISKYPSAVSWYNYGTALMLGNRDQEAISALREALRFDSTFASIYINLATASKNLHKDDDALRFYDRAARLDSVILRRGNLANEYGSLLVGTGRFMDAEQHYRLVVSRTNLFDRIIGFRGLGYLALRRGRLDEAVGHFRQANTVALQQGDDGLLSLMRGRLLEALTLLLMSDSTAAGRALDQMVAAVNDKIEPPFLARAGYGLSLAGRRAQLERLSALAQARRDSLNPRDAAAVRRLQAELAVVDGQPRRAVDLLTDEDARLRRLEVLVAAGQYRDALSRIAILDPPPLAHETQFEWFRAVVAAGDAAAAEGNRSRATEYYRRLVDYWEDGDSTATLLRYARRRITELSQAR
jgi:Tfp pilus assembly protein PilF